MLDSSRILFSNSQTDWKIPYWSIWHRLFSCLRLTMISISAYCFILCPSWTVESSCRGRNSLEMGSSYSRKLSNSQLPSSEGEMCSATHLIQTPWLFKHNNPETFPNLMGSLPTTLQIQPSAQQFRRLARWPIMKPKNWQLADPYLIWTEMYNSGEPRAAPPWSSSN